MIDYRAVTDGEHSALRRMRYYAFAPEDGPSAFETDDTEIMGIHRGLFDDDELLVCCSYFDFSTRLRGANLRMGGVAGVASSPEHRRKGLVRRLLRDLLMELQDERIPVSALWPFDYEFYTRLGWAMVCTYTHYEVEPEALQTVAADRVGAFRRVDASDWELLDPARDAFHAGYDLVIDRNEEWWRRRVFERLNDERYVYAWENNGEVRGYLAYHFEGEDSAGRTLWVDEFGAADPEARRQLFRFLSDHDSQVSTVRLFLPTETTLYDEVADPYAVDCEIKSGPMFRIVSVTDAMESVSFPEALEGSVTIAVADPLADWNDGTFEIRFADGRAICERVSNASPDVRLDVGSLSQLVAGSRSFSDLERLDSVTVENRVGADVLAAAHPPKSVHLSEHF